MNFDVCILMGNKISQIAEDLIAYCSSTFLRQCVVVFFIVITFDSLCELNESAIYMVPANWLLDSLIDMQNATIYQKSRYDKWSSGDKTIHSCSFIVVVVVIVSNLRRRKSVVCTTIHMEFHYNISMCDVHLCVQCAFAPLFFHASFTLFIFIYCVIVGNVVIVAVIPYH